MRHRFYWGDSFFPKIIEFLTAKPENFKHPGVMNLLSDMIYEKLDQIRYSESLIKMELCIGGISKALEIPRLGTRAIELLVYVGSTYDDDFYDFWEDEELPVYRRSLARKALRKSIEEPEVKAILQEMMEREPAVDLKIELLKMLRPDYFLDEFEEKIIENLSCTFRWRKFTNDAEGSRWGEWGEYPNVKEYSMWGEFTNDEEVKKQRGIAFDKLLGIIQAGVKESTIAAIHCLYIYFNEENWTYLFGSPLAAARAPRRQSEPD